MGAVVTFVLMLVIAASLSIRRVPEWIRQLRSANWPTAPGRIEGGSVATRRGGKLDTFQAAEMATAELSYSYTVSGIYYSGYHIKTFKDEQAAWSYVDGLKGRNVQVSYNPRRPAASVLRAQNFLD